MADDGIITVRAARRLRQPKSRGTLAPAPVVVRESRRAGREEQERRERDRRRFQV